MTFYTITEVLATLSPDHRSQLYDLAELAPSLPDTADVTLLFKFRTFAETPKEGISCALVWWLLHASGVNGDHCAPCHAKAVNLSQTTVLSACGPTATKPKKEYLSPRAPVRARLLREKSVDAQVAAANLLTTCVSRCPTPDLSRHDLHASAVEQSQPLRAFALALALWGSHRASPTGWLRPFLHGASAAREPPHTVELRRAEKLKTSVLQPGLRYARGFQWLAVQRVDLAGWPRVFSACPVGVFAQGAVMRVFASQDAAKNVLLTGTEVARSLYAECDWRVLDSWSNCVGGAGPFGGVAFQGPSACHMRFDEAARLPAMLLAGFCRVDGVWYDPRQERVRMEERAGFVWVRRNDTWDQTALEVTEDTKFG